MLWLPQVLMLPGSLVRPDSTALDLSNFTRLTQLDLSWNGCVLHPRPSQRSNCAAPSHWHHSSWKGALCCPVAGTDGKLPG